MILSNFASSYSQQADLAEMRLDLSVWKCPVYISVSTIAIIHFFFSTGKKKCWIPDGENAYMEAEVKGSEDDGTVIVETTDGKVKKFLFLCVGDYVLYQITKYIISIIF